MGVDVGIKIRMLDESNNPKMEIDVSPQDNSLASILEGSSEVKYLKIKLNDENFLSLQEREKIKWKNPEEDNMIMISNIIDSKEAIMLFDKIFRFTYWGILSSLEADIYRINGLEIDDEGKSEQRKSQIREYINFGNSLGISIGILKLAAEIYPKVQIVGEYY